jgi:hypothetical protein
MSLNKIQTYFKILIKLKRRFIQMSILAWIEDRRKQN